MHGSGSSTIAQTFCMKEKFPVENIILFCKIAHVQRQRKILSFEAKTSKVESKIENWQNILNWGLKVNKITAKKNKY